MTITYTQQYNQKDFANFILYGDYYGNTNIFFEYYNLIKVNSYAGKNNLTRIVKDYKPTAKSKLRISYNDNQIEFFKVNKHVFPVFYIIFK